MIKTRLHLFLGLYVGLSLTHSTQATMSFTRLGDLVGGTFSSQAWDISNDGFTVVGSSRSASGSEAFRWTQTGGMEGLGDLPGGSFRSIPDGISADGSTIVGIGRSSNGSEAFMWTRAGGMLSLGDLPGGDIRSRATGISFDGSVITGWSTSANGNEAFRWTQATGMVGLGDLPSTGFRSIANDISADGSTIVGYGESYSLSTEAFRWTQAEGMVGLGFQGTPHAISADGSVIAGPGWRWTESGGKIEFGPMAGDTNTVFYVNDISADGSIIVGAGNESGAGEEAVLWDEANGFQSLEQVLISGGVDLTDWTLSSAWGISADGQTIVGSATNPDGNSEAFMAVIPEPSTTSLFVFGGLLLLKRKRRREVESAI
jgi:probable HAF family extracellular repeat protein